MKQQRNKRFWAILLSAVLIVTQLPAVAMAENNAPEDGSIASFDPLGSGVAKQTVDMGTELWELNLPDTVTATIYHVTEDTVIPDGTENESGDVSTASPSDAGNSVSEGHVEDSSDKDSGKTVTTVTTFKEEIPVTWDSEPAYGGDTAGKYVFTADTGGYVLSDSVELLQIIVTVAADTVENPADNPTGEPLPCTKTEGCTLTDGHEGECDSDVTAGSLLRSSPADEYYPDDVAVVQDIIDRSTLDWDKDAPGSWNTTVEPVDGAPFLTWSSGSPKRITWLSINSIGLSGTLDLSDLSDLENISCYKNSLTGLDLSGLSKLQYLYCYKNSLSGLDMSDLTNLQVLNCCENNLTGLDVSGLTKLQILKLSDNPFQSLQLPDRNALTLDVIPAGSGIVSVEYDLDNKTVTLTAVPEQGHMFTDWAGDAGGSDNPKNITLDSDKNITANFSRVSGNVYVGGTNVAAGGCWKGNGAGGLTACTTSDRWTVSYAPATGVLTLRDAAIKSALTPGGYSRGIDARDDITIMLIGNSTVDGIGLHVDGDLTITGGGRLTAIGDAGEDSASVVVGGDILQKSGTLEGKGGAVSSDNPFFSVGIYASGNITLKGGALIGTGDTATGKTISIGVWAETGITLEGGNLTATAGEATGSDNSYSFGVFVDNGTVAVKDGTLRATGHRADAGSYGVYANGLSISRGTVIAQSLDPSGTAQAFLNAPTIDPAYTAARVWYGEDENAATGPHAASVLADKFSERYVKIGEFVPIPVQYTVSASASPSSGGTVTGGGTFTENASVTVIASANSGYRFVEWRENGAQVSTDSAYTFSLTGSRNLVAVFQKIGEFVPIPVQYTVSASASPSSGGTVTGGGTFTENASVTVIASANSGYRFVEWRENGAQVSTDSTYTFSLTGSRNLMAVFQKKGGGSSSGGSYTLAEPQSYYRETGEPTSLSISRPDLRWLADTGKTLTIEGDKLKMTFAPAVLNAILSATTVSKDDKVTFTAAPAGLGAFPDAAKLIGAHPVYNFTISYKDGYGNLVTVPVNFPAGSASITLSYAPTSAEVTGSLFMVYVDGKGAVTWLDKSSYDSGKVLAEVPHFSTYGVAYKAPAPVFTDITDHWAKEDIEFVAARGLLSGTGKTTFSPDTVMSRGMFVTALGRLAGIDPASYQTRSFTDVKADAYYAAYVEWAAQKNIVKGTGDKLFSPDAPVTREQMAVMMTNYAGQMGYSIPTPLAAVAFADSDKISEWAAKEVTAMQRAGIVRGKDGNRFDPQTSATCAEVSAVLHRFVEIVIDPATATGWVKNDSGHWLYYKGGTALTGWREIGGKRYYFGTDGTMYTGGWREIDGKWYYFYEDGPAAVNTKIGDYETGVDGARK